jgi:hypothetical protein
LKSSARLYKASAGSYYFPRWRYIHDSIVTCMCYTCAVFGVSFMKVPYTVYQRQKKKPKVLPFLLRASFGFDILQTGTCWDGKHRVDSNRRRRMLQLTEPPGHFAYLSCPGSCVVFSPLPISLCAGRHSFPRAPAADHLFHDFAEHSYSAWGNEECYLW